uniref:Protein takeout n=2 Tax=Glossina morsitans morsitans TaxID=37546 RepID=A0A1B0G563_GLOMM
MPSPHSVGLICSQHLCPPFKDLTILDLSSAADITRCRHGDTECIVRTSINVVRKYGSSGYAAAAFPVIEPFRLKRLDISDGRGGSLSLKLNFRDVDVLGLSGVNFQRAVGFGKDPGSSKFELYGDLPKMIIRGKYTADGRILILPIRGEGDADITLDRPKFSVKFKPNLVNKNGKTYLMVDKLKVSLEPRKIFVKLTNLFNGDQTLSSHMNQFLNENWFEIWSELQPSVQVAIAEIMKNILTNMFKRFAYDDIFEV